MNREGEPSVQLITGNGASWMNNLFSYKTPPHPKWTGQSAFCSLLKKFLQVRKQNIFSISTAIAAVKGITYTLNQ